MAAEKKPGFDWASLLQSFQAFKYKGPVGMLTGAILAIAAVLGIVALRTTSPSVQITLIVATSLSVIAFFGAVVLVIKLLGPYALLSGTQVINYWKMEGGAKGIPTPPPTPPIAGESGKSLLADGKELG